MNRSECAKSSLDIFFTTRKESKKPEQKLINKFCFQERHGLLQQAELRDSRSRADANPGATCHIKDP